MPAKSAAKQTQKAVQQAPQQQRAQPAKAAPSPAKAAVQPVQPQKQTQQKNGGPQKQENASPKQSQVSKAAPASAPLAKRVSLTPSQQVEQQQILNILLDDAGKDWKPRDKTPKQPIPKHATKQKGGKQQKAPVKQQKAAALKVPAQKAAPSQTAPKPLVKRAPLTQAQQVEQQQILNILLDDAGKDWKPRNKTAPKQAFKKPAGQKAKAPQKPKSAPAKVQPAAPKAAAAQPQQKPALLTRRSSLTDAQKKEKREIMEILLDPYVFVPARITHRGSATQAKAELHKVGNAVVVSNPPVGPNEDMSGFVTVKSRRTSIKEKKDLRSEQDAILSVLVDFKEPVKQTKNQKGNKQQTPTKAQSAHQQKVQPTKHITANGNQRRAKLAT
ncbi:hypothetical protein H310_14426 [Aphanomyces invadans]|uniref:Uncharacterized protein n=1 Tax=Aphanomyces invadans TaxID=157072 RepID=A0A024TC15_9STRA|nr:hypothetical protein H310_14426 [Aphanomyces invadans]ETV90867.1 hypothetical protein H310_14426 [Aphanomyces invadans]|eukprot:XP_008880503.1 hypothetical protein H310_14426 [Aphanomyces invadans]